MNVSSEPTLVVSVGPRPANSRPANSTREYEPGSGVSHDPAPVHHPPPARSPPAVVSWPSGCAGAYGGAPPASRVLRIADATGLRPALDPGASTPPGAASAGRPPTPAPSTPAHPEGQDTPRRAKRSGRERGKQHGASGSSLPWVADPDERVAHRPHGDCVCGADLGEAVQGGIERSHQVHDLPEIRITVRQHDVYRVRCACGREHVARVARRDVTGPVQLRDEPQVAGRVPAGLPARPGGALRRADRRSHRRDRPLDRIRARPCSPGARPRSARPST